MGPFFGVFPPRSALALAPKIPREISPRIPMAGSLGLPDLTRVPLGASLFSRRERIRKVAPLHTQSDMQSCPWPCVLTKCLRTHHNATLLVRFVLFYS